MIWFLPHKSAAWQLSGCQAGSHRRAAGTAFLRIAIFLGLIESAVIAWQSEWPPVDMPTCESRESPDTARDSRKARSATPYGFPLYRQAGPPR
jgi:hypothetical protein